MVAATVFLIDKFDITIRTTRDTYGLPTELKFIWLDQEKSMKFDSTPDQILLEDIKLKKGTGWMEAQLIIDGKIRCVQEIQIRPHGVKSVIKFPEASPPRRTSKNSKSSTTQPKLLDRFPEQTAPQPWTTGSSFFRANDGEMSVLGFDTTVAHIATEVTLFPGKG